MAATGTPTPNIGLRIPLGTDPASVDDINYNSNLLDTKLGAVGNDSVQDQIDALNGKISYWTLHPTSNVLTSNYATYTFYSGRNITDYSLITFVPSDGGWLRNGVVTTVNAFKSAQGVALYYHSGNNVIEVDIKYKTDTTFEAKYIGSPSGSVYLDIYGILGK